MAKRRSTRPTAAESSARAAQYQAGYDRGLSCSEIAREVGVSPSAVAQWLRAKGLPPHGAGNLPDDTRQPLAEGDDARPFPGHPSHLVTRDGVVYSTRTDPPLSVTARATRHGARVALSVRGRLTYRFVAPAVLEAFGSPRPDGCVVKFRDGDPANCRVENLEWVAVKRYIDYPEFVRVWQSSSAAGEAAERLGMERSQASAVASKLREKGVPLKRYTGETDDDCLQGLIRLAGEIEEDTDHAT